MKRTESTLTADDGAPIFLRTWEPDDGQPVVGTVQVVHGLVEHSQRYDGLAAALAPAGWVVAANDHRGHGRTATRDEDLGFFGAHEGWERVLEDLQTVRRHVEARHPGLPRAILGHSMGSFLVLETLLRHPDDYGAAVLSATKRGGGPLAAAGLVAAKLERARLGPRGRSRVLNFLSFGAYNLQFRGARTGSDWLSRDAAEVDAYLMDPRCGFVVTTQVWVDLLTGVLALGQPERLSALPKALPMFLLSGADDPVSNQAPPVEGLVAWLRDAGLTEVRLTRYPGGRHEMFHEIEPDRSAAFADVAAFLREALG